ncbi:hypothetical protein QBC36DRAFT_194676 [Triangularia setosa]|uniref:Uncharacterized protein n=1 Tax=Triangularia setosa TaxID=2587417 RepID=A0AAN7A4Y4_9PEZI|nr:hypothetical protein QBC36DRAFT_194676 [Podospora setosa]
MIPLLLLLFLSPSTFSLPTDSPDSNNNNNNNSPTDDLTVPTPEYPLPWGLTKSNTNPDSAPDPWTDDPILAAPNPQYPLPLFSAASLPASSNTTFQDLMSDARVRVGCTNNPVDTSELENSLTCLSNWCNTGNTIPPHGGQYCTVGRSMMYICSYGGDNPCSADEMVTAWGSIQRDCGAGRGGWWFSNDWKKTYGVDSAGANVCGNL